MAALPDTEQSVDLTNCDREPIHIPGAIQAFGAVVVCRLRDWTVTSVSANLEVVTGLSPADAVGAPLAECFGERLARDIEGRLDDVVAGASTERLFDVKLASGADADVSVRRNGDRLFVEVEPAIGGDTRRRASVDDLRGAIARMEARASLEDCFGQAAREVKAMTGFDRAMVYRFHEDGSGEVVAEAAEPHLTSYLNLRYPASDIPKQARALYARQLLRIIPDTHYAPVPLEPALDEHGEPIDLGLSVLRSVSPIHLEYLENMGVRATLTISLMVEGELWGLIACHHYSPLGVPAVLRANLEVLGQLLAIQIDARQRQRILDLQQATRLHIEAIAVSMRPQDDLSTAVMEHSERIARIVPCDGLCVCVDGAVSCTGEVPSEALVSHIVEMASRSVTEVFATNRLVDLVPEAAAELDAAAGVLIIPISRSPRDYIMLFRGEMASTVNWAGDPHKPAQYGPNGARLSPRKSFELWRETVRHQSAPWDEAQIAVAQTLRTTLLEVVLRHYDFLAEQRSSAAEREALLLRELDHRVKNILTLINVLVRKSGETAGSIDELVENVQGRIMALGRAHTYSAHVDDEAADLGTLVEDMLSAWTENQSNTVSIDGPVVRLKPSVTQTIALVIYELATNAAKYGALSVSDGQVALTWSFAQDGALGMTWRELGGPEVEMPRQKGFGSMVMEKLVALDTGGDVAMDFERSGLVVRISIPPEHVYRLS